MKDTIAAISTPPAPAGLGVIRLSGAEAIAIAGRVFRPADPARQRARVPKQAKGFFIPKKKKILFSFFF